MTYEITTITKTIFSTDNLATAENFFNENKGRFNYLELKEITNNGNFYYSKSIHIDWN